MQSQSYNKINPLYLWQYQQESNYVETAGKEKVRIIFQ